MSSPLRSLRRAINRKRGGKTALKGLVSTLSVSTILAGQAFALPSGGKVVAGKANISQPSSTELLINQLTSKAIINWNKFSVGLSELVKFHQPGRTAVILNRVVGRDPSKILGKIIANGQVFLINPNGIIFGRTAKVDVAGLLATTLNISNKDFMEGNYHFLQNPNIPESWVINQGEIKVSDDGFVMLVAPSVTNEGYIYAKLGKVVLASGTEYDFDFTGTGLIKYSITSNGTKGTEVINKGIIKADGGTVILTASGAKEVFSSVVNNEGIIEAGSLVEKDGKVYLVGANGADVVNSGTISVSAKEKGAKPGSILVKGRKVTNSGKIEANSIGDAPAGSIAIFSNKETKLTSSSVLEAKGTGKNADGGKIEVSSKGTVTLAGKIDVSSESGKPGSFFADPTDVVVDSTSTGGGDYDVEASNSIKVSDNAVVSTRNVGDNTASSQDYLSSQGNSGDLTFHAPHITIGKYAKILTYANNGYKSGKIVFNAKASSGDITVEEGAEIKGGDITFVSPKITIGYSAQVLGLEGDSSYSKNITFNATGSANVAITIEYGATLKGNTVTLTTQASKSSVFSEDDLTDVSMDFLEAPGTEPHAGGAMETSTTDSTIKIERNAFIKGNRVNIISQSISKAVADVELDVTSVSYDVVKPHSNVIINGTIESTGRINIESYAKEKMVSVAKTIVKEDDDSNNFYIAVAYGKSDLKSHVLIGKSAKITAPGEINILAQGDKDLDVEAKASGFTNGTFSGAVAIANFSEDVGIDIKGEVKTTFSHDINIKSYLNVINLTTKAKAGLGVGTLSKLSPDYYLNSDTITDFIEDKLPQPKKESKASNFSFSASFAYLDSESSVKTNVFSGAQISSERYLNLDSTCSYSPSNKINTGASASISKSKETPHVYSGAGALSYVSVNDDVETHVYGGANLSGSQVKITSNIDMHYGATFNPYSDDWDSLKKVYNGTSYYVKETANFVKSYVGPNNMVMSTSGGDKVGVAGMVSITKLSETSKALVDDQANIQALVLNINALSDIGFINTSGVIAGEVTSTEDKNVIGGAYVDLELDQNTIAQLGGTANATFVNVKANAKDLLVSVGLAGGLADKFAVSGTFSWLELNKTTKAYALHNSTIIIPRHNEGNINIEAYDKSTLINVVGGVIIGKSTGIGASAAFTKSVRDTEARISGKVIYSNETLPGNICVNATNTGLNLSLTVAGTILTQDKFRDLEDDDPFDAYSIPSLFGEEGAGAVNPTTGVYAVFASSVNILNATTKAYAENLTLVPSGDGRYPSLKIDAKYDTGSLAIGGTAAITTTEKGSTGLNGAFMANFQTVDTEAYAKNSTLDVTFAKIKASDSSYTIAVGSGGSVSASNEDEGTSVAVIGSTTWNRKKITLKAYIDNSTVTARFKDIDVETNDTSKIASAAVDFGLVKGSNTSLAAGASIAINDVFGEEDAYVKDSNLNATTNIEVISDADRRLFSVASGVSATDSSFLTASASVSINKSNIKNEAYIEGYGSNRNSGNSENSENSENNGTSENSGDNENNGGNANNIIVGSTNGTNNGNSENGGDSINSNGTSNGTSESGIIAGNKIEVKSTPSSSILVIAGALNVSWNGKLGIGAGFTYNEEKDESLAFVNNTSINTSSLVTLGSLDSSVLSIGITGGLSKANLGFDVVVQNVKNTVKAFIHNSTIQATGSVGVDAYYSGKVQTYGGTVQGGGSLGIGATAVVNLIENTVSAGITNSTVTSNSTGTLELPYAGSDSSTYLVNGIGTLASSQEDITTDIGTLQAQFGGFFSLGGSGSVDVIKDHVRSLVKDSTIYTTNETGNLSVLAFQSNKFNIGTGALSFNPSAGAGISAGAISFKGDTQAYIDDNSTVEVNKLKVDAESYQDMSIISVAGGLSGKASVAFSVGVVYSDELTSAYVNNSTIVSNNISINAKNDFKLNKNNNPGFLIGSVSATAGAAGIGGGVGVIKLKNQTYAFVSGSEIKGGNNFYDLNLNITANSTKDIYYSVANVSGGASYVGIGGSVSVISIGTTTKAFISKDSSGRISKIFTFRNVKVKSEDTVNLKGGVGQASASTGASIGAVVNLISLHSENDAFIGDDSLLEKIGSLSVNAVTNKNITTKTIGFGAGLGGVEGTVSIINIGSSIDDQASEAIGDTASKVESKITDPFSFDTGNEDVNQEISDGLSGDSVAEDLAENSNLKDRTTAAIGKNVVIKNVYSPIEVKAEENTNIDSRVGGGAFGAVSGGGSVNIVKNYSNISSYIDQGADIRVKYCNKIDVEGKRNLNATLITYAGSGGGVTLGAAVSYFYSGGNLYTYLGPETEITPLDPYSTNPDVILKSDTTSNIDIDSYGTYAGVAGVAGVVVSQATINGSTQTFSKNNVTIEKNNSLTFDAHEEDTISTYSLPVNAGAVSVDASVSEIDFYPTVKSYIGSQNTINANSNIEVVADLKPIIENTAEGIDIGGFTAGASVATTLLYPYVNAYIDSESNIKGRGSFLLKAEIKSGSNLNNKAVATHGGALAGITGSASEITDYSTVKAEVKDKASIEVNKSLTIDAYDHKDLNSTSTGVTVGGIFAAGLIKATINYCGSIQIYLYKNSSVKSHSNISIESLSSLNLLSKAVAGTGGVVSGDATQAETNVEGTTSIVTYANSKVCASGKISLHSKNDISFNSFADSINASIAGKSGADAENTISDLYAKIELGDNSYLEGSEGTIYAETVLDKPSSSTCNANEGSGGVVEGVASYSKTEVKDTGSYVKVGENAKIRKTGSYLSDTTLYIKAINQFDFHDKAKLNSGGVIDLANSESIIDADDDIKAEVDFLNNAKLEASGNVVIAADTKGSASVEAMSYTYGGYSYAQGSSEASLEATDQVNLNSGVLITASKSVTIMAGADDSSKGYFYTHAHTDIYNKALVPYEGDPDADAYSEKYAYINIDSSASVKTGTDIILTSIKGDLDAYGYGKATDAYKEALKELKHIFGDDDDDGSIEKTAGTSYTDGKGTVTVNGLLETGIYRHQYVTFKKDFDPGFYVVSYLGKDGKTKYKLVPNAAIKSGSGYKIYDKNGNYVKTIKPSEISNGISWSLITDTAIGEKIDERIQKLKELLARYSADDTTKEDLKTEIALLEAAEMDQAMDQTTHIIKLDKVFATSGDIKINTDYLKGKGSLKAPGDVSIKILNYSPLPLTVGTLEIPWYHGGHIMFNGVTVHDNEDIAKENKGGYKPSFSMEDGENSPEPIIKVENFYEKTAYANDPNGNTLYMYAPPILVGYSLIDNKAKGNTYVSNLGGEVDIKSEGSIIVTEGISANKIKLDAGGNFIFNNPNAVYYVLGDPKSQFNPTTSSAKASGYVGLYSDSELNEYLNNDDDDSTSYTPYNSTLQTINPYAGYTIAGNNVFINAEIIDINGIIQSGIPDRVVTISPFRNGIILATGIGHGHSAYKPSSSPPKFFVQEDGEPVIAEGIKAEFKNGKIYISDVSVQGGTVFLSGRIINTGNAFKKGWINVMDGYGRIRIVNCTPYPVVIKGIDTGGIEGKVIIIDKNRNNWKESFDPRTDKYFYTVKYVREGNTIKVYDNFKINSNKPTKLEETVKGRVTTFQPLKHMFYYWVSGTSQGSMEHDRYVHDFKKFLGFIPAGDTSYEEDWFVWGEKRKLSDSELPKGDIVGLYPDFTDPYEYKHIKKTTTDAKYVYVTEKHYWSGLNRHTKVTWDVYTYSTTNNYYFHYVKADYPIKVHFIGYDQGLVDVISPYAPIEITGPVRNPEGTTYIQATSIKMSNLGILKGGTINLSSVTDIGTKSAPVKIGGATANGNTIIPTVNITASGNVNLQGIDTDMKVSSIITNGDINITSDKDIIFKSFNPFKNTSLAGTYLKGKSIYLKSNYGKVVAEGDEFINVDTNDTVGGTLTVLAGTGDIKVRELSGNLNLYQIKTSGNVYVEVPFGSLIDANPNELKDDRTIAELKQMWGELGLTGESAKKLREQQVQAYNRMMEAQYFTYWREYRDLKFNPDGTYTYSPYRKVRFTLSQKEREALKTAGWTDKMIQDYEDKMTNLYNEWGKKPFDPNFKYDVKAEDPKQYELLTDNEWTDKELQHPLPSFLFKKNVTDTVYVKEKPNIIGHDVYLLTGNSVGIDKSDIVYNYAHPESIPLEEREKVYLALAAAEIGDVNIDTEHKTITIHQRDDIDIDSTGKITAIAGGHVYLGSDQGVTIYNLYSRDDWVRLKVYGNILASINMLNVSAPKGLIVEASHGKIGTQANPLSVYLRSGSPLVARASGDINILAPIGDLNVEYIYTPQNVFLSAPKGGIYDYFEDVSPDIHAKSAFLVAKNIGERGGLDKALNLYLTGYFPIFKVYASGDVNVSFEDPVYLEEGAVKGNFDLFTSGNLRIGNFFGNYYANFVVKGRILTDMNSNIFLSQGSLLVTADKDINLFGTVHTGKNFTVKNNEGDIVLNRVVSGRDINIIGSPSTRILIGEGLTSYGGMIRIHGHDVFYMGASLFPRVKSKSLNGSISAADSVSIDAINDVILRGPIFAGGLDISSKEGEVIFGDFAEGYRGIYVRALRKIHTPTRYMWSWGGILLISEENGIYLNGGVIGRSYVNLETTKRRYVNLETAKGEVIIYGDGGISSLGDINISSLNDITNYGYILSRSSVKLNSVKGRIKLHGIVCADPTADYSIPENKIEDFVNKAIDYVNQKEDFLSSNFETINNSFNSLFTLGNTLSDNYRIYYINISNKFSDVKHFIFNSNLSSYFPPASVGTPSIPIIHKIVIVKNHHIPEIHFHFNPEPSPIKHETERHEISVVAKNDIYSDAYISTGQDVVIKGSKVTLKHTIGAGNLSVISKGDIGIGSSTLIYAGENMTFYAPGNFESKGYLLGGGEISITGEKEINIHGSVATAGNVLNLFANLSFPDFLNTIKEGKQKGVTLETQGDININGLLAGGSGRVKGEGDNINIDGAIEGAGITLSANKDIYLKGGGLSLSDFNLTAKNININGVFFAIGNGHVKGDTINLNGTLSAGFNYDINLKDIVNSDVKDLFNVNKISEIAQGELVVDGKTISVTGGLFGGGNVYVTGDTIAISGAVGSGKNTTLHANNSIDFKGGLFDINDFNATAENINFSGMFFSGNNAYVNADAISLNGALVGGFVYNLGLNDFVKGATLSLEEITKASQSNFFIKGEKIGVVGGVFSGGRLSVVGGEVRVS
ncbi:MAG: filamentous hemagglutinin N-terminal domain-containing protein, partial [Thermodesulfobacteria bacterium]|nr:filamentous hemagglutinin N-terminal domain-containing protein [Thermodesulfobacteriota bacterium]